MFILSIKCIEQCVVRHLAKWSQVRKNAFYFCFSLNFRANENVSDEIFSNAFLIYVNVRWLSNIHKIRRREQSRTNILLIHSSTCTEWLSISIDSYTLYSYSWNHYLGVQTLYVRLFTFFFFRLWLFPSFFFVNPKFAFLSDFHHLFYANEMRKSVYANFFFSFFPLWPICVRKNQTRTKKINSNWNISNEMMCLTDFSDAFFVCISYGSSLLRSFDSQTNVQLSRHVTFVVFVALAPA